jgi:predicted nucleic acid-binding protein
VILVDTSVWVDHLNDHATIQVRLFRQLIGREHLPVGDLILYQILQGLSSDGEAAIVEAALKRFDIVALGGPETAARAAAQYRLLRDKGVVVRKTIQLVIAAYCLERRVALLHSNPDFEPMHEILGLQVV